MTLFARVCDLHLASGKEPFAHNPRVETYQCGEFTIRFNGTGETRGNYQPYSGQVTFAGLPVVDFDRYGAWAWNADDDVLAALDKAIEEATR